jgi:FKBP-type peptidyl-prolyl cis-trans isomerase SlyD
MKIDDDTLVSIEVEMYDAQGNLLEKSDEQLTYLHGHGDIFGRIEEELRGKEEGADVSVHLEPEEAFGDYDPELVTLVPVEDLGEGAAVGMRVDGAGIGASTVVYTITDIAEGMAVLDGNHPLAGFALRFEIKVMEVRAATSEEIQSADAPALPDFLRVAEPSGRTLH